MGYINLLQQNEILFKKEEDYNILQKRNDSDIETFVIIPLKDLSNGTKSRKKVEER